MNRYYLFELTQNVWRWNGENWKIIHAQHPERDHLDSPFDKGSLNDVLQYCAIRNTRIKEISKEEAFLASI